MSTRWRLYGRVQGLEEEKSAYWNWLEKHRNLREVKKMASLRFPGTEGWPRGLGLSIGAIFRIEH